MAPRLGVPPEFTDQRTQLSVASVKNDFLKWSEFDLGKMGELFVSGRDKEDLLWYILEVCATTKDISGRG
jgi:hypothetical protein